MSLRDTIGTVKERLENRVGRSFGNCSECGNPTRSHTHESGNVCHDCYTGNSTVPMTDGGEVLPEIEVQPEGIPEHPKKRDRWLNWMYEGNGAKRAVGPWERDGDLKPIKGYKQKTTSFEEAESYTDLEPYHVSRVSHEGWGNTVGLFYLLPVEPDDDSMVFIDLDDVRDPETGTFHPTAIELFDRADSYCQISTSGTGAHILVKGSLPGGHETIQTELEATESFPDPEIEVYTRDRLVGMTGNHIDGTPESVNRNNDLLEHVVDEYAGADSVHEVSVQGTEPEVSEEELSSVDTTTNIQDQFDAVAHISPGDIRTRSTVTEERSDSADMDPSWAQSDSGTRLARLEDGWVYRAGMVGLDAAKLVALEEGIIRDEEDYPTGEDWFETVEKLRERGAHIPELDQTELYFSNAAVLPSLSEESRPVNIKRSKLQERTYNAITTAIANDEKVCVDAIMSSGKSYGTFKAIAEMDRKASVFVARNDMKEQAEQYALQNGIDEDDILVLPSITEECPTWNGAHGEGWQERIQAQYQAGASPKAIHSMNEGIPCRDHDDDDDEDAKCPYEAKWDFDPDNYQVIIGHYKHSHVTHVTMGRVAVFDESPTDQFTSRLEGQRLIRAVNTFLSMEVSPPVGDFTELLESRNDPETVKRCSRWFNQMQEQDEIDLGSGDSRGVVEHVDGDGFPQYHAYAPHAVYSILNTEPVAEGSDFERGFLPGKIGGSLFFTTSDEKGNYYCEFLESPELHYATSVIALDGTPLVDKSRDDPHQVREWSQALGIPLHHRRILSDAERQDYIQNTLQHRYVSASEYINPYSSGKYNDMAEDAALLAGMKEVYGRGETAPLVFTPKAVADEYADAGFVDRGLASELNYPGNLRGTDKYAEERLLAILGSTHHGDHEIRRRAAWLREDVNVEGKGSDRDYGSDMGNAILQQMRENVTAQMAMRVGRDGGGATIVLKTTAAPDYLPVIGKGGVTKWSDGMKQVTEAWQDLVDSDAAFVEVGEVADHPAVEVTTRQVRNALGNFVDLGYVKKGQHPTDGRKSAYTDDGLSSVAEHDEAEVELPDIEWPDDMEAKVPETVRTNVLTSDFRFSPSSVSHEPDTPWNSDIGDPTGANWGDERTHDTS